jgi:ribonuclease D
MTSHLHQGDLPEGLELGPTVAVDTETLGLNPRRDRLCVVQLSSGDGTAHVVHFPEPHYESPNLRAVLSSSDILKIFHYARFDAGVIEHYMGIQPSPLYCTKIASRLVRTYTDRHGLKDLVKEMLGIEISKQQQSSDWGAPQLSQAQVDYAASDVLHLHRLKESLDTMLEREGRTKLAQACFDFVPVRAQLDLEGWAGEDIFSHS